jgi:iron(III) transport system substrate-binding protein
MNKSLTVFLVLITMIVLSSAAVRSQTNPDPKLIEGAKKEGRLVYWSTMTVNQSKEVVDAFKKKYPFIEVNLYRTGGDAMINKALTEARAGRHEWDVINTRGDLFLSLMKAKLLASYHSPEAKHIPVDLVDKEGYWTAYYVNPYGLGYNTSIVKKTEVPRTYEELLDPKWKRQKISIDNTAYNFLSGLISAWGKEKAVSYFRKLAAQEPVPMRGNTHRVQLVMAGETPLL